MFTFEINNIVSVKDYQVCLFLKETDTVLI